MTDKTIRPVPKDTSLGPLVRMHAYEPSQIPAHPTLAVESTVDLETFLNEVFEESERFITTYLDANFKSKGEKESSPAAGKIQIYSHDVTATLPTGTLSEAWFARISKHENAVKDGTASFEELDGGLRQDHAIHEKDYTPDLEDAHLVLDYSEQLAKLNNKIGPWSDVQVEIREMVHHLPAPLNKRHFSTMVIAGRKADEFIDTQLPIDLTKVKVAKYAQDASKTPGIYCSVEYGKLIGDQTEWRMATASDAGGALPMWAQKMGMPGAIAKDVGLFVSWRQEQRKSAA